MNDHIRIFKAWTESDGNPRATWVIERQDAKYLFEQLQSLRAVLDTAYRYYPKDTPMSESMRDVLYPAKAEDGDV